MLSPKFQSLLEEAIAHHRAGRYAEAEERYARVRAAAPTHFDAVHLSGLAAYQMGRPLDAVPLLRRALKLNPASSVCEMRLGLALIGTRSYDEAETHLQRAVRRAPEMCEAWHHLGVVHRAKGRIADAIAAHQRAAALNPSFWEAHERLGVLLSQTAGAPAAIPHLRKVCELAPRSATAAANLGVVLAQAGELGAALQELDRALALEPTHALALTGRALVLQDSYRIADAVETYGLAIASDPSNHEAWSGRLLALHYLEDRGREQVFAEHVSFGRSLPGPVPRAAAPRPPRPRLRIAFLSPDLRAHSVAYFLEPILERLDRDLFEVHLYHDHHRVDATSERLRGHASVWRNFAGMTHATVEPVIRADAPDVLVDLAGHTGRNRLPLFAKRLAPVQITYLGYPDTTGVPEMDFRLVDPVTDPDGESDRFHTETLVRFAPTAWSYCPPPDAPEPAPRAEGAPVTFGCFNNGAKLGDAALRAWARILAAVPGSRLLLKGKGFSAPSVAAALRARLGAAGVAADRVDLVERTQGLRDHLALYSRVDVALDTFPYHGTTTTCEALWMGVPVVTLGGDRHASRVGESLLRAVGHPEWIARDWDSYAEKAVALASDAGELGRLRRCLRGEMRGSALLDHESQARRFERAVIACARSKGISPQPEDSLILDPVVSKN